MAARTKLIRPAWALTIEHARESLSMNQAALARRLRVSPMAVSRWERGINEPSAAIYIQFGKMVAGADRWLLWERAGLTRVDVETALAHSEASLRANPT